MAVTTLLFILPAVAIIGGAAWALLNGVCEHLEADDAPAPPRAAFARQPIAVRAPALAVAPRHRASRVAGHIVHGLHH